MNGITDTSTPGCTWNGLKTVSYKACRKFPFGNPGEHMEQLSPKAVDMRFNKEPLWVSGRRHRSQIKKSWKNEVGNKSRAQIISYESRCFKFQELIGQQAAVSPWVPGYSLFYRLVVAKTDLLNNPIESEPANAFSPSLPSSFPPSFSPYPTPL